jgi:hypothetical protein
MLHHWLPLLTSLQTILSRVRDVPQPAASGSLADVVSAYTACARAGRSELELTATDLALLTSSAPDVMFEHWSHADLLRLDLLLSRAAALGEAAATEVATAVYDAGDAAEQRSWLRGVSLLPSPAQFTPQVIDACRTNILPVFEAVASYNPFPAEFLPERNFNQMVLKALFNSVPLATIVGLGRRRNAELARMAGDYADERRAAGRTVPSDIGLAL